MNDDLSQGAKANLSGNVHEKLTVASIIEFGCTLVSEKLLSTDIDCYCIQPTFTTIYNHKGRADLAICFQSKEVIRIECKKQNVEGSVDEKIPYVLENFKSTNMTKIKETHCVLFLDGTHFLSSKKGKHIYDWAINQVNELNKLNFGKQFFIALGTDNFKEIIRDIKNGKYPIK